MAAGGAVAAPRRRRGERLAEVPAAAAALSAAAAVPPTPTKQQQGQRRRRRHPHQQRQQQLPVAPLLLALALALLLPPPPSAAEAGCPGAPLDAAGQPQQQQQPLAVPPMCDELTRVCADQRVFVLYGNEHNPRHELYAGLPRLVGGAHGGAANVTLDYAGFGDVWGTERPHPRPAVRPATPGEETAELQRPQFSRCALPLVVMASRPYSYAAFFAGVVAPLHMLQQSGALDRRVSLVIDAYGMALEPFHRLLLAPLSLYEATTLSHLSSRAPLDAPEGYAPDGRHVRCFRRLFACAMGPDTLARLNRTLDHPLHAAGRAVFEHHKASLPAIDPEFADASKLRVLIAALPRRNRLRAIVNQEQVWSWCSKFTPPAGVAGWNGTACLLHEFGRDPLEDIAYASQADVLLGTHGEALTSAFFMKRHSHVVEVRPHGFAGPAAARGVKKLARADGDAVFWWGLNIANPAHSAPGLLETQRRGLPETWARDRHVFVRLMACQYLFERIALTRVAPDPAERYRQFRAARQAHISDLLERLDGAARRRRLLSALPLAAGGSAGEGASAAGGVGGEGQAVEALAAPLLDDGGDGGGAWSSDWKRRRRR